jgi:hypothetical protein
MDDTPADRARQERQLDEALKETFPASDPVAIQHIGGHAGMPARGHAHQDQPQQDQPQDQSRQRLARRRLRALIDRHDQTARP